VINNPFAYTDPSGNWGWKNFFKAAKPIIAVAAAAAVTYVTGNPALGGFVSGLINTGTLKGAAIGAASGALFWGAGEIGAAVGNAVTATAGAAAGQLAGIAAGVVANGVAGGAMSMMQGGDFGSGFLAGSVAKGLGSIGNGNFGIGGGEGDTFGHMIARVAVAGTIGGIASRAGGGDFWSGFETGAFSRLFNTETKHGWLSETLNTGYDVVGRAVASGSRLDPSPGESIGDKVCRYSLTVDGNKLPGTISYNHGNSDVAICFGQEPGTGNLWDFSFNTGNPLHSMPLLGGITPEFNRKVLDAIKK